MSHESREKLRMSLFNSKTGKLNRPKYFGGRYAYTHQDQMARRIEHFHEEALNDLITHCEELTENINILTKLELKRGQTREQTTNS